MINGNGGFVARPFENEGELLVVPVKQVRNLNSCRFCNGVNIPNILITVDARKPAVSETGETGTCDYDAEVRDKNRLGAER